MSFLRQSTQVVKKIGPYLDKTDGVTEETGLAGAGTEISKEPGAAYGTGPTLGTHDAEGWYPVTLTTTHTDTVGLLIIKGHDPSTHLPVWHEFTVIEEAVYDQLYAASAPGAATPASVAALQQVAASGAVETSGSNSSTQVQTDLAEASDDHYDVMTILFTSGAEAGQSRLITGYVGSTGVVSWNAPLTGTPADDVTFVIIAAGTTADAVWDEIITGATHNITNSAGKRLRQLEQAFVQASGTIAAVTNGHTITLDAGAVATTDYYPHSRLTIVEGTGAGQSRLIINYTSGRVVTLESDFTTNPDTNSLYTIEAADANASSSTSDLAQGFVAVYTDTTTITLDSNAVATTDYYKDTIIVFTGGTGAGQEREISAYTSGRVATLSPALITDLDATTTYRIIPSVAAAHIADEVWDEAQSDHTDAGSMGEIATEIAAILVDTGEIGTAGAGLTNINLPNQTMDITGDLSGSVGSVTGAVGSVAAGGITASSFAAGAVDAAALSTDAGTELADALLDRASAIDGLTPRNLLATLLASVSGVLSGAATTTVTVKNPDDDQTRITATVDSDGNRSAITLGHTGV